VIRRTCGQRRLCMGRQKEVIMIIADHSLLNRVESNNSRPTVTRRIALIDAQGNIVAVNQDWMTFAEVTGAPLGRVGPGVNYLEVCRHAEGSSADSRKALVGISDVLKQKTSSFAMDYACDTPAGPAYFRMVVTPIAYMDARVAIAHTDVTDLNLSKEKNLKRLRQFARRLINAQEEERQRIAREIHDDLGNRIALMSLSVHQIMEQAPENLGSTMNELQKVLDGITELSTALRNLSHWLHPPPLRYLGIGAALTSLQEVFKKTYGIRMDVVIPANLPRLPDEVELCIFRISQECLQNVAKHSGAAEVRIVLEHTPKRIRLTVSDTGRGFSLSKAVQKGGLGLASMRERALSIRGRLTVNSSPGAGTKVLLMVPIHDGGDGVHACMSPLRIA
jgi:signal transduction histidine kinase